MDKVCVLHILKKSNQSRRPASWRNPNITQTKEVAIAQITAIKADLDAALAADGFETMLDLFKEIASKESDCSSAERGGDLGDTYLLYCIPKYVILILTLRLLR